MQKLYRISGHFIRPNSRYHDSDYLTFFSKASSELGVLRSCKNQFFSMLKAGKPYFIDILDDYSGDFVYFWNGFFNGKTLVGKGNTL